LVYLFSGFKAVIELPALCLMCSVEATLAGFPRFVKLQQGLRSHSKILTTGSCKTNKDANGRRITEKAQEQATMMSVGFPVCLARQTGQNHSDAGRKRRKFITILGGAANAWPRTARVQQPERMRRIGVLGAISGDDQDAPARITAFQEGLQQLGWIVGVNVQIDYVGARVMPKVPANTRQN
jgi:hypothetical protein